MPQGDTCKTDNARKLNASSGAAAESAVTEYAKTSVDDATFVRKID